MGDGVTAVCKECKGQGGRGWVCAFLKAELVAFIFHF